MTPETLARLAQIRQANTAARLITKTGEPCRCPESQLDCLCGAYENTEAN